MRIRGRLRWPWGDFKQAAVAGGRFVRRTRERDLTFLYWPAIDL